MFPFPALDCHAHVDPTVTAMQVRDLDGAHVFAMTRSLAESEHAIGNPQPGLLWGIGAHPAVPSALDGWSLGSFETQIAQTPLVGEVGMDRRGSRERQREVLDSMLQTSHAAIFSLHSTGRTADVVDSVERANRPGIILHWFLGTPAEIERAVRAGCFFSINAAMSRDQMKALPINRVLPETDFPASRSKTGARVPGDITELEVVVSALAGLSKERVRRGWYANLHHLIDLAGVRERLPSGLNEAADSAVAS